MQINNMNKESMHIKILQKSNPIIIRLFIILGLRFSPINNMKRLVSHTKMPLKSSLIIMRLFTISDLCALARKKIMNKASAHSKMQLKSNQMMIQHSAILELRTFKIGNMEKP